MFEFDHVIRYADTGLTVYNLHRLLTASLINYGLLKACLIPLLYPLHFSVDECRTFFKNRMSSIATKAVMETATKAFVACSAVPQVKELSTFTGFFQKLLVTNNEFIKIIIGQL